jgi:hypothetical protein
MAEARLKAIPANTVYAYRGAVTATTQRQTSLVMGVTLPVSYSSSAFPETPSSMLLFLTGYGTFDDTEHASTRCLIFYHTAFPSRVFVMFLYVYFTFFSLMILFHTPCR